MISKTLKKKREIVKIKKLKNVSEAETSSSNNKY